MSRRCFSLRTPSDFKDGDASRSVDFTGYRESLLSPKKLLMGAGNPEHAAGAVECDRWLRCRQSGSARIRPTQTERELFTGILTEATRRRIVSHFKQFMSNYLLVWSSNFGHTHRQLVLPANPRQARFAARSAAPIDRVDSMLSYPAVSGPTGF